MLTGTEALVKFTLSGIFEGNMSARGIATMVRSVYNVELSHQTVLEILKTASEIAEQMSKGLDLRFMAVGIFDEIFQGNAPILSMADPVSGLIALKASINRTGEQWEAFAKELKAQGFNPQNITTDAGSGLLKGLIAAFPQATLMLDLFHVLYKLSKARQTMQGICYKILDACYKVSNFATNEEVMRAIQIFDEFELLFERIRKACYLMDERGIGYYTTSDELNLILVDCYQKLEDFYNRVKAHKTVNDAISYLKNGTATITSYKKFIEDAVKEAFGSLDADFVMNSIMPLVESLMQYQRTYENSLKRQYWGKVVAHMRGKLRDLAIRTEAEIDSIINKSWEIIHQAAKSNSYIESLNSVLRRHLDTFKTIPQWFCQLFTFFWNNRVFERGKRAGMSPTQIYQSSDKPGKCWLELIMEKFPFDKFRSGLPVTPIPGFR